MVVVVIPTGKYVSATDSVIKLDFSPTPRFAHGVNSFGADPDWVRVLFDIHSVKELDRQRRSAHAPNVRPNLELYRNAALLELGVSELAKMQIETLR